MKVGLERKLENSVYMSTDGFKRQPTECPKNLRCTDFKSSI